MLLIAGLCCIPFTDFILVAVKLLKISFSFRILFFKHFPDESKPHRRGMALWTPWIFTEVSPLSGWKPVTQQCDQSCQGHSCAALLPPWPLAVAVSRACTSRGQTRAQRGSGAGALSGVLLPASAAPLVSAPPGPALPQFCKTTSLIPGLGLPPRRSADCLLGSWGESQDSILPSPGSRV